MKSDQNEYLGILGERAISGKNLERAPAGDWPGTRWGALQIFTRNFSSSQKSQIFILVRFHFCFEIIKWDGILNIIALLKFF